MRSHSPATPCPIDCRQAVPHLVLERLSNDEVGLARVDLAEADVVELGAGEQQPCGGEEPGERRHDHGANSELACKTRGVDRARAAVCDECELARVAALLGRDGA